MGIGRVTLTGASSDGTGTRANGRVKRWYGGTGHIAAQGTHGGATAKVQFTLSESGSTWSDVNGAAVTSATSRVVSLTLLPCIIRLHTSGATSTTSLNVAVLEHATANGGTVIEV